MKITATINQNGKIKRQIDFQGASLPDGRSIDDVLNENRTLKIEIDGLKRKAKESSSILIYLVPNKNIRIIVELVLIVATIIGIIALF